MYNNYNYKDTEVQPFPYKNVLNLMCKRKFCDA